MVSGGEERSRADRPGLGGAQAEPSTGRLFTNRGLTDGQAADGSSDRQADRQTDNRRLDGRAAAQSAVGDRVGAGGG